MKTWIWSVLADQRLMAYRLLLTSDFSDLEIRCRGTTFKVHRCILSSQSEFFTAICRNGFKVSLSEKSRVIMPDALDIRGLINSLFGCVGAR